MDPMKVQSNPLLRFLKLINVTLAIMLISACEGRLLAQSQQSIQERSQDSRDPKIFLHHLIDDQKRIWTSPFHARLTDAEWMIPAAGVTVGLLMSDRTSEHELTREDHLKFSRDFSDWGLLAYGGGVTGLYLLGQRRADDRMQETGLLAAESGLNAFAVSNVIGLILERQNPEHGDGKGHFFRPVASSFDSTHAAVAWSFASVIAEEYPGWLSQSMAYGGATAISLARSAGGKHFPADIFAGAATGYLIGRSVYRRRHESAAGDSRYGKFVKERPEWQSDNAGSTYVPLDSWVYPVLDRLIATGMIRYQFLGLRPYTRTAIADMVREAEYRMGNQVVRPELRNDVAVLRTEFKDELSLGEEFDNNSIRVDSLYIRSMAITGQPLNDSYHFGQTIINDYGRPYEQGFNQIGGFTARAEQGRLAYYFRGEYQHAPGTAALPQAALQVIGSADHVPVPAANPVAQTDRFRVIDAYASMTLLGHNIAIGKQELWWGPDAGDAMILSANANPFYMLQINRTIPLKLPWPLKYLGPVRYDAFFGKLADHRYPPQPYMHGEKFSFKPTENLELGWSRTAVFAGQGVTPLTFGVFWSSLTSTISSTSANANVRISPGVRHGQFDFSYRLPGLRNWVTLYSDSLVHDDVSPVDAPRRAAINPGIYVSHFPKLGKLDFRAEAVNTDPPIRNSSGGSFIYYEGIYRDVYSNAGQLMGSWIGREGKGVQAWATYSLNPQSSLQLSFRNAKVAKDFIPQGESINDVGVRGNFRVRSDWELSTSVQMEHWTAPILSATPETNVTMSIQLTYWPKHWKMSKR